MLVLFYKSCDVKTSGFECGMQWLIAMKRWIKKTRLLYIKENQGELANLSLRCFYNNKFTPETCCVIG